ncbi:MAG: hypothetical protein AB1938_19155 [Myxococcota bacterium]
MRTRGQWRVTSEKAKRGRWTQLNDVAEALGVTYRGGEALDVRIDGQRARLQLIISFDGDGVRRFDRVEGLELLVFFEGAPPPRSDDANILLRVEDGADRAAKKRGVAVEVQLGSPGFDREVYIDNTSSEADVRRILAKEATRQAVRRLLAGHVHAIRITPQYARVKLEPRGEVFEARPILEALEDLLIVARAGGPKDPAPAQRGLTLLTGLGVSTALAGLYAWYSANEWPAGLGPLFIGGACGALVAFFSRPALESAMRGGSGSGRRVGFSLLLLWAAVGLAVTGALTHLNGALDDSKATKRTGVVASVAEGSVGERVQVRIRWKDGEDERLWTPFAPRKGDRVTEYSHPGALGFDWREGRTWER